MGRKGTSVRDWMASCSSSSGWSPEGSEVVVWSLHKFAMDRLSLFFSMKAFNSVNLDLD